MYGSGRSNDPVHSGNTGTLAGEGSHFDNSRDTPSGMGLGSSHIGNALTTAGPHSTDLANKADPRVDSDLDGSRTAGNTTGAYGSTGQSSMPGAFESHSNPYSTQEIDPRLGAPTTTSGLGSNTTGTGYNTIGQSGITGQSTTGNTDSHLGRDAATVGTAGAVGEGIHHHREKERENLGTSAGVSGTGYRDNTGIGNTTSNTTTGPHSSSLLNKLDPRVDSNSSGTVDNTGSDRHYGRDAAVGAGGVGLAEHEHRKHERERETGVGSTTGTGIGSNTGAYSEDLAYTGTTGSADHHYGRDAAVGAGGVGLAEHERRKHERERETGVGSSTGLGSNTGAYGDDPNYTGTTGVTGHHYGRDAAVGASGVGLAEHEHRKHEREREAGVDSNTGIGSTAGAYRDDPSYTGTAGDSGHHYGRDAALGAGGVGLAEHEHRKHERERESGLGGTTGTTAGTASGTGPAPNTAGPHSKDWMNKLDPRVKSNPDAADTGLSGTCGTTHGERDAVAGAGLAGAGGYEAEKHHAVRNEPGVGGTHDESLPNLHHTGRDASAIGAATALDENEKARLRAARGERDNNYNQGPVEPGYGSATTGPMSDQGPYDPGYNPTTTGPMHEQSRDHHLGRDAAGAGVIGDAAYEADKHYKHDKDLTAAEREQKRELKHEEKEAKREQKEEKKHHGLLGFLRKHFIFRICIRDVTDLL
jgi:uncharacterized protein YfiM (DUF2279 family)